MIIMTRLEQCEKLSVVPSLSCRLGWYHTTKVRCAMFCAPANPYGKEHFASGDGYLNLHTIPIVDLRTLLVSSAPTDILGLTKGMFQNLYILL